MLVPCKDRCLKNGQMMCFDQAFHKPTRKPQGAALSTESYLMLSAFPRTLWFVILKMKIKLPYLWSNTEVGRSSSKQPHCELACQTSQLYETKDSSKFIYGQGNCLEICWIREFIVPKQTYLVD